MPSLTWLTVTVAFAPSADVEVNATVRATIEAASPTTIYADPRFPSVRLQIGMRDQIARIDGVSAVAGPPSVVAPSRRPAHAVHGDGLR